MSEVVTTYMSAGEVGQWRIERIERVVGEGLRPAARLQVSEGAGQAGAEWVVRGFRSNLRYTTHEERAKMVAVQAGLGRVQATVGVLIPIRKNAAWWELAQDERRAIFEEQSRHIAIGLEYLPPVARRLYHSRDLGEKWDFLTWFEFAPEHEGKFDDLLKRLRETREWGYVDRECEVRLRK